MAMETVKGSIKSCHTVQIKFPFEVVSGMYKETRNKYKIYGTLIQPEKNRWAYIYNTVILKGPINYLWQGVIQKLGSSRSYLDHIIDNSNSP